MSFIQSRSSRLRPLLIGLLVSVFLLALVPVAHAAVRIYWGNYSGNKISFANLNGSGGGDLNTAGATLSQPLGVAIDSAAGRIYWVGNANGKISFAALDGSGGGDTPITVPSSVQGLGIDPTAHRLYWPSYSGNKISFANLNGSGGGDLNTTGATVSSPIGVAIDPAAGRIYWANNSSNKISFANLNGSGGGDLNTTGATVATPTSVALDPVGGRIYWTNFSGVISFANLNGSGGGDLNTTGTTVSSPEGIAVDPFAGRVYWTSYGNNKVEFANTNGSGGGDLFTAGATTSGPAFLGLLDVPAGSGAPEVSGGSTTGSTLSCSTGAWALDLVQSFLNRAPQSFAYQWTLNGGAVSGATGSIFNAISPGDYRCQVTAINAVGSAGQTSGPHAISSSSAQPSNETKVAQPSNKIKLGKLTLNSKKGTALLRVTVPNAGKLALTGKGLVGRSLNLKKAGATSVTIKSKGKKQEKLNETGKVTVKTKLTFTPTGGSAATTTRSVTLTKKLAG